jgi:hypothetical protein
MTPLQQILLTLTSISNQLVTGQMFIQATLAKEAQGIPQITRELLRKNQDDDMKRLQLLAEAARLIAHIE